MRWRNAVLPQDAQAPLEPRVLALHAIRTRLSQECAGLTREGESHAALCVETSTSKLSSMQTAIIPGDVPQLVYDIKYHTRDYRRHNTYTAR